MLIDDFLPQYDVHEYHQIDICAPAEQVYAAVRLLDLSNSFVIRWLFRMRGLPVSWLRLDGLLKTGFVLLGEQPRQEMLLGLIGQFWKLSGGLCQELDAESFRAFDQAGYAKAAWNFSLVQQTETCTRLATETRVYCLDDKSRRQFRRYWRLVGPFSAWTRKEALRLVKQDVERLSKHT